MTEPFDLAEWLRDARRVVAALGELHDAREGGFFAQDPRTALVFVDKLEQVLASAQATVAVREAVEALAFFHAVVFDAYDAARSFEALPAKLRELVRAQQNELTQYQAHAGRYLRMQQAIDRAASEHPELSPRKLREHVARELDIDERTVRRHTKDPRP